jgi:hypothetical protein
MTLRLPRLPPPYSRLLYQNRHLLRIILKALQLALWRKPERREKPHDFRQNTNKLFSHESVARSEPMISKVKGTRSDDCATEDYKIPWSGTFLYIFRREKKFLHQKKLFSLVNLVFAKLHKNN